MNATRKTDEPWIEESSAWPRTKLHAEYVAIKSQTNKLRRTIRGLKAEVAELRRRIGAKDMNEDG
jgi:uncharacterized coiled-coil DUF342 family protein